MSVHQNHNPKTIVPIRNVHIMNKISLLLTSHSTNNAIVMFYDRQAIATILPKTNYRQDDTPNISIHQIAHVYVNM